MRKIGVLKLIAILMSLHFCGVSIYSYSNDSIVIESESDTDSEGEDAKKEHKLISSHAGYTETKTLLEETEAFFTQSKWNVPHIEISSPPPDLI